MISDSDIQNVIGQDAYGSDGEKIGRVGQVFLDDETGRPEFATVNTGFFGSSESYVPIADATTDGDGLRVPFTKDKVKGAPNVAAEGGHLEKSEERELYDYYGMPYSESASDSGLPTGSGHETGTVPTAGAVGDTGQVTGHDTSGPTTDDAMTRSEERLDVGTVQEERGRARLRKYVTTEQETVTVPVRKERAVIETEPVTDANVDRAASGPDISEEEHEVVLTEERAVAAKTTEPVERVRLGTETVTDEETVTEDVRKEHIEAEGDVAERRGDA